MSKLKGAYHKSFSVFMKEPEPKGLNPFFQEAPSFPLKMHKDAKRMAVWGKWLINEMRAGMIQQSAKDNRGVAKFILAMAMKDPDTLEHIGYRYKLLVTPDSGYFKVLLIPHRELVQELGSAAATPIQLVFDFTNLYLMGFDARLDGLKITPQNEHFIVRMGFDGGYFGFGASSDQDWLYGAL